MRLGLDVMTSAFHPKQYVVGSSLGISKKLRIRLLTNAFPKPHGGGSFVHWVRRFVSFAMIKVMGREITRGRCLIWLSEFSVRDERIEQMEAWHECVWEMGLIWTVDFVEPEIHDLLVVEFGCLEFRENFKYVGTTMQIDLDLGPLLPGEEKFHSIAMMAVSFKYWDDCIDPSDMEAMWNIPEVSNEWLDAGESRDQKVHLSRDPDGQPFLTQIEMKAVAEIITSRHFNSQIDLDMICAIAELESDRQPLAVRSDKKNKEPTIGIMQLSIESAKWLFNELGYRSYEVVRNPELLYWPFVSVYLGAAYMKWLSNYDQKERTEEFIIRAYKGGTKKATHKSTLPFWKRYLCVKESLPSRKFFEDGRDVSASASAAPTPPPGSATASPPYASSPPPNSKPTGVYSYWDTKASPEDMEELWSHPEVLKEWTKSGEIRGKVRFSHDNKKRPYLSRVELKAVAEIILTKHFLTKHMKPTCLCALAEVVSLRFVNGVGPRTGIMGIDYSTAFWLYMELGYRAYRVDSADDLTKPFVSMYFGAAYLVWLSEYEGRERTPQFVVQAYISGPKNVNLQETGPLWLKFMQALGNYEDIKKDQGNCSIL